MAKLSDRQRKQIIAEYIEGDGKVSQRSLAKKYNVSLSTISKILSDEKVEQKCTRKKEENMLSMLEYLDSRKNTAQALMEKILSLSEKDIEKANLRDKMGALKILSEVFTGKGNLSPTGESGVTVQINVRDCSGGEKND